MKKVVLIILLFLSITTYSQNDSTLTNQQLTTKVLLLDKKLQEHIDLHIQAGRYSSTASSLALASGISFGLSSFILLSSINKYGSSNLQKQIITLSTFFGVAGTIFTITSVSFNIKAKRTIFYQTNKNKNNW